MSEKLYSCHCSVEGHGCNCCVAEEMEPDRKSVAKLRRKRDKKIIKEELKEITPKLL